MTPTAATDTTQNLNDAAQKLQLEKAEADSTEEATCQAKSMSPSRLRGCDGQA